MQSSEHRARSEHTARQRLNPLAALAAVIDRAPSPTIAWGRSALALHGLAPYPTIPHLASAHRLRCLDIHRSRVIDLDELASMCVLGVPVATLPLAIASAAGTMEFGDFDRLVTSVVRRRLLTQQHIERAFSQLNDRGRAGTMLRNSIVSDRTQSSKPSRPMTSSDPDHRPLLLNGVSG